MPVTLHRSTMRLRRLGLTCALALAAVAPHADAQTTPDTPKQDERKPPVIVEVPSNEKSEAMRMVKAGEFTVEELYDGLVAPIALYPDCMLTPMLGAAREPAKVTELAKAMQAGASVAELNDTANVSFAPLAHVPEALELMAYNVDWTDLLGQAMSQRRQEVMAAIQRVRKGAMEAGHLKTDEVLTVSEQRGRIAVRLTDPGVLRVPRYEPSLVVAQLDEDEPPLVEYGQEITFPGYRTVQAGLRSADAVARMRNMSGAPSSLPPSAVGRRNYGSQRNLAVGLLLFRGRANSGQPIQSAGRLMAINAFAW